MSRVLYSDGQWLVYDLDTLNETLAQASDWLDKRIVADGPNHLRHIRVSKLGEEVGEVQAALISLEGSNPRKEFDPAARAKLETELLDVALTALLAFYHVSRRLPLESFAAHAQDKIQRYYGIRVAS